MTGRKLSPLQIEELTLQPGEDWVDAQGLWRLIRLQAGAAYWIGPGTHYSLALGDALVLGPEAEGTVRASQIGAATLQAFCFSPDLLWGVFTIFERRFFESEAISRRNADVKLIPVQESLAERFADLVQCRAALTPLTQRLRALELVAEIFSEQLSKQSVPPPRGSSGRQRFHRLLTRLADNDLLNHGPEELAQMCGCSQRHFNRLFRHEFGISVRERQTDLRIVKAKALLITSDDKIIDVAQSCGYRSLGLFNTVFKKKLNMTPSEWRKRAARKASKVAALILLTVGSLCNFGADTNAPTAVKKSPIFEVKRYAVSGNTILDESVTTPILEKHTGPAISFEEIRQALVELQGAYRERGFVTVAVGLPQQQITNGTVKVQVTEGRLAEVRVVNNHYFSSNNVIREFPSLRTNTMLNSLVFQQDLDRANANRDRQIYPIISPGAEPGSTDLELKVKDRLPLHARIEFNNNSTPNTPDLRLDSSVQYNNLWQLNHQLGAQYSFAPQDYKKGDFPPYDKPLIANYSAFYRLPIPGFGQERGDGEIPVSSFGYDEATHHFKAPPAEKGAELIVYASRSSSDTAETVQSQSLTPAVVPAIGGLQIFDQVLARTINPTENLGFRFMRQLPDLGKIESGFSFGLDYKNYRARVAQTRVFHATVFVPEIGSTGPPFIQFDSPPIPPTTRISDSQAEYLPISAAWNGARKDKTGVTSFDFGFSFQPAYLLTSETAFQNAALDKGADGRFCIITAGLTREQNLGSEFGIRIHADGQWANEPLLSTEQFALGGLSGVRGYHEGQVYGDRGWRFQLEPHLPYVNIGLIDNKLPVLVRAFAFFDAGQRFLIGNGLTVTGLAQEHVSTLLSVGVGFSATAGEHFEGRFQIGVPILNSPTQQPFNNNNVVGGDVRAAFGIAFLF